jgi:hypothetical protein
MTTRAVIVALYLALMVSLAAVGFLVIAVADNRCIPL